MLSRRLGSRAFHQPETDGPTSVEDIYVYSTAVPQGTASADDPSSPGPAFHHPRRHTVDLNTKHTRKGPAEPTRATLRRPGQAQASKRQIPEFVDPQGPAPSTSCASTCGSTSYREDTCGEPGGERPAPARDEACRASTTQRAGVRSPGVCPALLPWRRWLCLGSGDDELASMNSPR